MLDLNAILQAILAHQWLAAVLPVAIYLRALVSNKSAFPVNLSPNWQPAFVGVAGAVVTTVTDLTAHQPLQSALLAGSIGFVAGGFLDGLLVAICGSPANAPAWAKMIVGIIDDLVPPQGGNGTAGKSKTASGAPKPPPLSVARLGWLRRRGPVLAFAVFAAVLIFRTHDRSARAPAPLDGIVTVDGEGTSPSPARPVVFGAATGEGCAWWQSNSGQVVSDVGKIASCVIAQLFGGAVDPNAVVGACVGATISDVEQIVQSIIDFYDQPDAGTQVGSEHFGSGPPPFDGLPKSITHEMLLRLKAVHVAAKAQLAAGAR